ncbi:IS701 family transposase, partial [Kamptonema formosum]|uniref:IS701 family transposase n=1 Tax=Kamptonema formosum TaxID=331992 RepID=UPI00037B73DE
MVKPRAARPTVNFIDEYCAPYRDIFPEVRSFEAFKLLHLGMISDIKRKTLPAIAKISGLENEQSLHHFLTQSPWKSPQLKARRLELILKALRGRKIILIIDETGSPKKGTKTDYVSRQYIGPLGKVENGLVAVAAYGLIDSITFPLIFEVYKPRKRLQPGDVYKSKPEIAVELLHQLREMGFEIERVLADSFYGERNSRFIAALEEINLPYLVAIRKNYGVWIIPEESVTASQWKNFKRVFPDGHQEIRFIREWGFGQRRERRYWEITTDTKTLPSNSTWYAIARISGLTYLDVGNFYGSRTWIEDGFKESKNELGWADFRLTQYEDIEKWWEIVE